MPSSVLVVHGDKKTQRLLGRVITSGVGPVQNGRDPIPAGDPYQDRHGYAQ